jgi:uncharacterized protein (DUF58 family)
MHSFLPSRVLILLVTGLAAVCTALAFSSVAVASVALLAAALGLLLMAAMGLDVYLSVSHWRTAPLSLERQLPRAFAVGRPATVRLALDNPHARRRVGQLHEWGDSSLQMPGMPLRFDLGPQRREVLEFEVTPTERGVRQFDRSQILLRSSLGLLDLNLRIGLPETRRVFPNFENQTAFAWLSGERRLSEIGIKAVRRRGTGTDFDQLVEYQAGDPIRHIDWKATLTHHRPIVRKYQDDRDQTVMLLLDCGRRMRADDTQRGINATHFDQALNAVMLLAFVALTSGDAVGAATFGTRDGMERRFAPRKGRTALNALMAELGDVQPTATFSDYARVAADLIQRQRKRALVVVVTNCRDEDAPELGAALAVLRSRHLVVLANLREQVVALIAAQPLTTQDSALEVAAALEYEHARGEMLRRFAIGGALTIDCEPQHLAVQLVNRYTILKRAGAL